MIFYLFVITISKTRVLWSHLRLFDQQARRAVPASCCSRHHRQVGERTHAHVSTKYLFCPWPYSKYPRFLSDTLRSKVNECYFFFFVHMYSFRSSTNTHRLSHTYSGNITRVRHVHADTRVTRSHTHIYT